MDGQNGRKSTVEPLEEADDSPWKDTVGQPARAEVVHLANGVETAELVVRARAGDVGAESLLYRRHAGDLVRVVTRLTRSATAAEDVVHDTFLLVFERLKQLREPHQFRAWALSIAVSLVRKRLRRQKLLEWVGLEALASEPLEAQARDGLSVEARGELAVLDAVLNRLPANQRLAWALRHIEGEKLDDVALLLGRSLATTKRYIAAAERRIGVHVQLDREAP